MRGCAKVREKDGKTLTDKNRQRMAQRKTIITTEETGGERGRDVGERIVEMKE
jgi:hypothetical protein